MTLNKITEHKCFEGMQYIYSHASQVTHCTMRFGIFLPPNTTHKKLPVLYWLSGLTCTEENFIHKAGAQRMASKLGIAIVVPDTSPRGLDIPGENERYDIGTGASFYIDATQAPWSSGYKMYQYITQELRMLVANNFLIDETRVGIFGHSMGGHGALMIAAKNPHLYHSVSAFAPICSPMNSPWGEYAFETYLGSEQTTWREYDATFLIEQRGWKNSPILIDQGTRDEFYQQQLKPNLLVDASKKTGVELILRMQEGYDHSYFFISTFMDDHLSFHAENLK